MLDTPYSTVPAACHPPCHAAQQVPHCRQLAGVYAELEGQHARNKGGQLHGEALLPPHQVHPQHERAPGVHQGLEHARDDRVEACRNQKSNNTAARQKASAIGCLETVHAQGQYKTYTVLHKVQT